MQNRDEDNDDKTKALRAQLDLCRRLAQESSDPDLAKKLRKLADRLKEREAVEDPA